MRYTTRRATVYLTGMKHEGSLAKAISVWQKLPKEARQHVLDYLASEVQRSSSLDPDPGDELTAMHQALQVLRAMEPVLLSFSILQRKANTIIEVPEVLDEVTPDHLKTLLDLTGKDRSSLVFDLSRCTCLSKEWVSLIVRVTSIGERCKQFVGVYAPQASMREQLKSLCDRDILNLVERHPWEMTRGQA